MACARASVVVVVLAATRAADHDLVLLDRDLDRAVARPVLGVDGVVLHGGVQPQAVALLAVVEGALQRRAGLALAGAPRPLGLGLGLLLVLARGLLALGLRSVLGGLALGLRGLLGGLA